MSDGLMSLLGRVEAAGGPINVAGNRIDVGTPDDVVAVFSALAIAAQSSGSVSEAWQRLEYAASILNEVAERNAI